MKITKKNYEEVKRSLENYEKRMMKTSTPLDTLDISTRLTNCLFNGNIKTVEQLKNTSVREFIRIRNFGAQRLLEVEYLFKTHNWKLLQ